MLQTTSGGSNFSVLLEDQRATSRLVIDIANALEPGDFVTLSGDLGAGKTTFTRALIRYLAEDQQLEVPSPTFTLLQTYDLPPFPLVHIDLFRLSNPGELTELGLDDLPDNTVTMLEWPDRAANLLPRDRLEIAFTLAPHLGAQARQAQVTGPRQLSPRAPIGLPPRGASSTDRITPTPNAGGFFAMPRPVPLSGCWAHAARFS